MASNTSKSTPPNAARRPARADSPTYTTSDDDWDGVPTRASHLTGVSPIFTVSAQTSPIVRPPIYRELNDPSTTFQFTWRVDGPTPSPRVFPVSGGFTFASWRNNFNPVTAEQLNGNDSIFRVEPHINRRGGIEGCLLVHGQQTLSRRDTSFHRRQPVQMNLQQSDSADINQGHGYHQQQNWEAAIAAPSPFQNPSPFQSDPGAHNNINFFASSAALPEQPYLAPSSGDHAYPPPTGYGYNMPDLHPATAPQQPYFASHHAVDAAHFSNTNLSHEPAAPSHAWAPWMPQDDGFPPSQAEDVFGGQGHEEERNNWDVEADDYQDGRE